MRELERVCEEAAAELVEAGVEPSFRIASVDGAGDATLICFSRRPVLAPPVVGRTTAEPRGREVTDICLHAIDVARPFAGQGAPLRGGCRGHESAGAPVVVAAGPR